jgi:hypothetical protein
MSEKHSFVVFGRRNERLYAEASNARQAEASVRIDGGFKDVLAVIRLDAICPGPRSRMQAVCAKLDPDNLETCRAPFIAFISEPA